MTAAVVVTPTSPLWYTTRAAGLVALVLLTISVVLGVLTSVRFASPRWPRFVTIGLHRNMSLLAATFVLLHVVTTVTDPFASIHWSDAVVPFVSSYRPLWLGLGTVAFDLLIALTATSLLRVHLSHRAWRLVHWSAYLCWPAAVVHGLGTGTDTSLPWVLGLTVLCVAAVVAAVAWRLGAGWPRSPIPRIAASGGVLVALIGCGAWLVQGPLHPGWARRSGTPPALLAHSASQARPGSGPARGSAGSSGTATLPAVPFRAPLSGTAAQAQAAGGEVRVTITATASGPGDHAALDIVITGVPDGGGVAMTRSQVSFGPADAPRQYSGRLTALNGTSMRAAVSGNDAGLSQRALALDIALTVNGSAVTGSLSVSPGGAGSGGGGGQ